MENNKKFLKQEIERMVKELGISKSFFKRTLFTVSGKGFGYEVAKQSEGGHKASLKQQYSILKDLLQKNLEMKEMFTKKKEAEAVDNGKTVSNINIVRSFFEDKKE